MFQFKGGEELSASPKSGAFSDSAPNEFEEAFADCAKWRMQEEQTHYEYTYGGQLLEFLMHAYDVKPQFIKKATGKRYGVQVKRFKEWCEKLGVCSLPVLP